LGIYLNFQRQYITSKSISPTFWIQILPCFIDRFFFTN
jgi:hypothetical protein